MPEPRNRKEFLLRLTAAEQNAIEREVQERESGIEETAGLLTGLYRPDELKRLREDWTEAHMEGAAPLRLGSWVESGR